MTIRRFCSPALFCLLAACGESGTTITNDAAVIEGTADAGGPAEEVILVTPIGEPTGAPVAVTIGAEGGVVEEPTSGLTVEVPVGALASAADVTLQPVSNMLPTGVGDGVAIAISQPQTQPVIVRFSYGDVPDPEQILLAMQADDGSWKALFPRRMDPVGRTISVALPVAPTAKARPAAGSPRRISAYYRFVMNPTMATVKVGKTVALKPYALVTQRESCSVDDCSGDDCLLAQLCSKAVTHPVVFTNDKDGYTRQWFVNNRYMGDGTVGTVQPTGAVGAIYTAPSRVPSPATVIVEFLSINETTQARAPAIAFVKIIDDCDGAKPSSRPQVCLPPVWTGTASEDAMLGDEAGTVTLNRQVRASVTWKLMPGDTTRSNFEATGTATYSATGTQGPCTIDLPSTTLAISGQLQLISFASPGQYYFFASNPPGEELCYRYSCPPDAGGNFMTCGPPKPWSGGSGSFSPEDTTISGSSSEGGITYAWSFSKTQ